MTKSKKGSRLNLAQILFCLGLMIVASAAAPSKSYAIVVSPKLQKVVVCEDGYCCKLIIDWESYTTWCQPV